MTELDRITKAKNRCAEMMISQPGYVPLQEVFEQLSYLESALLDRNADRGRLGNITLGLLAAREFEVRDYGFAVTLYSIEEIVDHMKSGTL
jgi:hypothetical protein